MSLKERNNFAAWHYAKQWFLYFQGLLAATLILMSQPVQATHIRAGDLVIRREGQNTFCITMTLYRDTDGIVGQVGLLILYNPDGSVWQRIENIPFTIIQDIPAIKTQVLQYQTCISGAGAGRYCVAFLQDNRNIGVRNMSLSGETPFFIESCFESSPFLGNNSNPILTYPPLDNACVGQRYVHNPQAVDPEGDSLSYRLVNCKRAKNTSVQGFVSPVDFSRTREDGSVPPIFSINPRTGDIIWDAPAEPGEYNIAYEVLEWRRGFPNPIGIVNRDMQIIVEDCNNQRPRIQIPRDTCIVATPFGTTLLDTITATDPDRHYVQLTWSNRDIVNLTENRTFFVTFDTFALQPPFGKAQGLFTFTAFCNDVRREPYLFTFRAEDFPEYGKGRIPPPRDDGANQRTSHSNKGTGRLVDLQTWSIRVVGPAPENLQSTADRLNATIRLNWSAYSCPNAEKMVILRREGSLDFTPTACNPIPDGYEIVGEVPIGTTTFLDNNNGRGLKRGVTYCYRIYAAFPSPKFGESLVSAEVCEMIPSIAPYLTNVTVDETSRTTGRITVRWTKPIDIDLTAFPRPHTYRLARATGFSGNSQYVRFNTIFAENDTVFQDTNLNTEELVYNYRILFYSNNVLVDSSTTASSVRLSVNSQPTSIVLTWQAETPWSNRNSDFPYHYLYRNDPVNAPTTFTLLDSIRVVSDGFRYEDKKELLPDSLYCYYVVTSGTYGNPKIREPLLNASQKICATLKDTLFPCPPLEFSVVNQGLDCNIIGDFPAGQPCPTLFDNFLRWKPFIPQNQEVACDTQIARYQIYYSPRFTERFDSLRFLANVTDTFFLHRNLSSIAGCYAIKVVDRNGNESSPSNIVCLDNCPSYRLPNVFTPNGDNINDVFRPLRCPLFVKSVNTKIFNRWGEEVFASTDTTIDWDGRGKNGNQLSEGVYYYVATVVFHRLREEDEKPFEVKGTIHLIRTNN